MILQRLYELAVRENLLDDPAFEVLPVPYLVLVGEGGEYLGFSDIRGVTTLPTKKAGAPPKQVPDKGRPLKVPRAHGNTASQGFARFYADTLPRVLPLVVEEKDQKKADASRKTFWEQIDRAAEGADDQALRGVQAFGRRLDEFTDRIRADVAREEPALTDRVTFAYRPSGGRTLLEEDGVRRWYTDFFAGVSANKQDAGPVGVCQVTGTIGPIPKSHPTKLQGVPGGIAMGVALISFDKPAFGHYGLDGTENAGLGYAATDGYLRALDSLLKNSLPSVKAKGGQSKLVIGGTAFLYWTKDPTEAAFVSQVENPTDEGLKQLPKPRIRGTAEKVFDAVASGKKAEAKIVTDEWFHVLALSGNSARAVVRGYLETTLPAAKANVAKWFADLRIADTSKQYSGAVNDLFSLNRLAGSTVPRKQGNPDWKKLLDDVPRMLFEAALHAKPIGDSLLLACLHRLTVEGSEGFRPERMALIKLILIRKGVPVEPQLVPDKPEHAAYVYGRFLAICEDIQRAALGKVNTNIVDRFYGRLSTAPSFILRRMIDGALDHLKRVRTTKEGLHAHLDRRLAKVIGLMPKDPLTGQMSFEDQARFSIGYYHEKAAGYARIAAHKERKAKEEEKRKREAEEAKLKAGKA